MKKKYINIYIYQFQNYVSNDAKNDQTTAW